MKKTPKTPAGLTPEARRLWVDVVSQYQMDGPGLLLLREACLALMRLRDAQEIIRVEGITVRDRFGQPKQHPAFLCERDARTQLLQCIRELHLDFEPGQVGTPLAKL